MKRIISACLCQTIKFEGFTKEEARTEYEQYLKRLDMKKTKYVVDEVEEKGNLLKAKIRKQYNTYSAEGYLE